MAREMNALALSISRHLTILQQAKPLVTYALVPQRVRQIVDRFAGCYRPPAFRPQARVRVECKVVTSKPADEQEGIRCSSLALPSPGGVQPKAKASPFRQLRDTCPKSRCGLDYNGCGQCCPTSTINVTGLLPSIWTATV